MPDPKNPASAAARAGGLEDLLEETRVFRPDAPFSKAATIADPGIYDRAAKDPVSFWEGFARELTWDGQLRWLVDAAAAAPLRSVTAR